jgi:signal transduction histidine kinase
VGLGLSIVSTVITAHGGEVRARARSGGGMVVIIDLPAARVD